MCEKAATERANARERGATARETARDREPKTERASARARERERERERPKSESERARARARERERASERARARERERASDIIDETRTRRTVGTGLCLTRESGGSRPSTGPLLCVSIVDFLVVVFFSFVCDAARGMKGRGGSPRSSNHRDR